MKNTPLVLFKSRPALSHGPYLVLFLFPCISCAASNGAASNSPDLRNQVSGTALHPETEATHEKTFVGKVQSVQGAKVVVENNGHFLKVELKQMTPLKVGDRVQLQGSMVGDTLMAAGVRVENRAR